MKQERVPLSKRKVGKQKPLPYSTIVPRYSLGNDPMNGEGMMVEDPEGDYVSHLEYAWMANYADRLVEFGKLPCLPADLENLRASNTSMATELEELRRVISDLKKDLTLALL
jgi:hypothetical protein